MTLYGFSNTQETSSKRKKRNAHGQSGQSPNQQNDQIAENLLQVDVYFQSLNIQTIAEEPKYEVLIQISTCIEANFPT